MDVSLLQEWLNQIAQNLPVLAISVVFIGTIFGIAYKVISTQNKMIVDYIKQAEERQVEEKNTREEFRKDVYSQLNKTLDIYQDVQVAIPLIKSFMERYPKMESVINALNQNKHSYYDFLESIISRAKYSFKANFKNGSHEDEAMETIEKSYEHIMRTITEEDDLLQKPYHVCFANLMKEQITLLTEQLLKMDDSSIKLKTIEGFFSNFRNLLYHFRIYLNDKYLKMSPEKVKEDLQRHFEGLELHGKNEQVKEISETEEIFGF